MTAGRGLGLFGVLSIIRLRSFELDQQEVAYYFVSLAMGVLGGVPISPTWMAPALMAAMLGATNGSWVRSKVERPRDSRAAGNVEMIPAVVADPKS